MAFFPLVNNHRDEIHIPNMGQTNTAQSPYGRDSAIGSDE